MPVPFATQSITRLRPTTSVDSHGNDSVGWDDADDLVINFCSVQPGATDEDLQNREGVLIQWTVYAPAGADVRATDAVVFEGVRYAVDGEPKRWKSGLLDHTVIALIRWEG